jgi:hypothetical protein
MSEIFEIALEARSGLMSGPCVNSEMTDSAAISRFDLSPRLRLNQRLCGGKAQLVFSNLAL